jgi:hypothetical protein
MPHWTEVSEQRNVVAEIKFLVPLCDAGAIRDWARARLTPDPFGEGPFRDTYRTASIYFDTTEFDVLQRRGSFGRSKYRIRRYGKSATVFLERKLKKRDLVSKRRSVIELGDLSRLSGTAPERRWSGFWFHRRILARDLHPVCQISYGRTALAGGNNGHGPIRLTLDDDLWTQPIGCFGFDSAASRVPIVNGHAILELKYRDEMPRVFRELIESFSLNPQPISKYRLAMAESNLHVEV